MEYLKGKFQFFQSLTDEKAGSPALLESDYFVPGIVWGDLQIVAELISQHPWREALWSTIDEETEAQGDHATCPGRTASGCQSCSQPLQSDPRVQAPRPWQLLSLGPAAPTDNASFPCRQQ